MNVVLIVIDTLRADTLGNTTYGPPMTPYLTGFGEQGAVFTAAYPESLPTVCVRRALHSGRRTFPFRNYVPRKGDPVQLPGWNPLWEDQPTLAEVFLEAGYRTALVTDNWHLVKPSMNFLRGFTEWDLVRGQVLDFYRSRRDPNWDLDPYIVKAMEGSAAVAMLRQHLANNADRRREQDWTPAQVFSRAADWLTENAGTAPFFLCIDSFDPHEPWDPPQDYVDRYAPGYSGKRVISPMYGPCDYLSASELAYCRALYAGEVTLVDHWLGVFLDRLGTLDLETDTVVAVISDHGISIGEHGLMGKLPWGLYPEVMTNVLMLRAPGQIPAGTRIGSLVSNHDLIPTIFEYARVAPSPLDGRSLRPLIAGKQAQHREFVTSRFWDFVWYRDARYWYIARTDGVAPQLFDLDRDLRCEHNIAGEQPQLAQTLHARILADAGGDLPTYGDIPVSALGVSWYKQFQMNLQRGRPDQ